MMPNRLNQLIIESGHPPLVPETSEKFAAYLALLLRWNARTNLSAIRDEEGILRRHFLESILCAHSLPVGLATLLDFGSGAGFPGLPIALLHPEISVTLAESQHKKAAFLREAVRVLNLTTTIHAARAETLKAAFDCVTLRAVDNMPEAISTAIQLLTPTGWLAVLTTIPQAASVQTQAGQSAAFDWRAIEPSPAGSGMALVIGRRQISPFNP